MTSNLEACRRFLSENAAKEALQREVESVIISYGDLRLKKEEFTFNDGTSKALFCLNGTIPVLYKSSTYNIPVAIFLYDNHPHKAPIVYVRPTPTMQIKANNFVDTNGLVCLPYISEWKHPGSDLVGLLAVLQVTFGERPPVFSRLPAPSQPISAAPYPPSYPQVGFYPQPAPGRVEIGSGWQMPTSANICTMPMPQMPNYNSPFPDSVGPAPNFPNPQPGNPYDPQKTEAFPATPFRTPETLCYPTQAPAYHTTGSLTEDQLLPSIRSAVADKIRREQQELIYQYNDELKAIGQTQSELNDGRQKLLRMIEQMKDEQKKASENLEKLERENKELEELCANLDSAGEVDVDEAVFIEYPLYRQLVSSFAKEQAIEDAMYYLREALGKGVLDLDTYLERIRRLSKDQFELRSTVLLCRQEAGLPG
ncbi:Tumor susceptibility protein 101 [Clonorchis sinensis]|uniref:Tumor susceptibility protein 101 n=2 Tax=Clonorchis sinensis TaxID=79923 RepID=A0A8T1M8J2_CLOSI|nr:Tumor susceptibility protein 101 [Clonorchis sinensis]